MIYLDITGRLGNQMFQYAFVRKLGILTNDNIQINTYKLHDNSWDLDLLDFNITNVEVINSNRSNIIRRTSFFQKLYLYPYLIIGKTVFGKSIDKKTRYQLRFQKLLNSKGIYYIQNGYSYINISKKQDKMVYGHFENPILFKDIRNLLLEEFTPRHPILEKNEFLYSKIVTTNSVCVSIRRGDYYSLDRNRQIYGVCTIEYYRKAIQVISRFIENPVFYVFSDDIEWAKSNISFPLETFFETGSDPVWEKMRLMYSCKHFIISNSTFSWWAQYLSSNQDKIVVSPVRWRNDSNRVDLIDSTFITIER